MTVRRVWGIAAVLLALACWLGALWAAAASLTSASTFSSSTVTSVNLAQGSWTVFQLVPQDSQAVLPADVSKERTLTVEQVSIKGPDGQPVTLSCAYCGGPDAGAIPIDLRLANPVANFAANQAGDYTVTVAADAAPAELSVANPVTKLESVLPWVAALGVFGVVFLTIGILLIVVGRGGPPMVQPMQHPEDRPPGWYPNPYQPGTDSQMWWDGTKWTSNWR